MPQVWKIVANTVLSGSYDIVIPPERTLWAWGDNLYGQSGNGLAAYKISNVGSQTTWVSASCGVGNSAAIKSDGTLWLWGRNNERVVDTTTITRSSPVQVGVDTNWLNIKLGENHAIALKTDSTIYGWGANSQGQTGYPLPVKPTLVDNSSDWVEIPNISYQHTGAIKIDGTLWMWGQGNDYQIGDLSRTPRSSPVQIGTNTWLKLATGAANTLAIRSDNTLWGWGYNIYGVLGLGPGTVYNQFSSPVQVGTGSNWAYIYSVLYSSYGIKTDGTLWGWGYNPFGNLGIGNTTSIISEPVQVGALTDWLKLSAGVYFATAIKTDGTLWSWGYNNAGQLGNGTTISRSSPVQIGTDTDWIDVGSGNSHSMAIKTNGTLWGWGSNGNFQIGDTTNANRSSPVQIGTDTNWSRVYGGSVHTVAIKTDGTLWAWGNNSQYQLGDGTTAQRSFPVQIGSLSNWTSVCPFTGDNSNIAINSLGDLYGWGNNNYGQLATNNTIGGNNAQISQPSQLNSNSWKKIAAAYRHSFAIKDDDTLWGTGLNSFGQIGNGNTTDVKGFEQIGSEYYKDVGCGQQQTIAIRTDGTLWGWGSNSAGELGNGTTISRSSPVQIGTDTNWSLISVGQYHTNAIKTTGTLWGWGLNTFGQIGDGTNTNRSSPVQIGTDTNWAKVFSGHRHTIGIKTDNSVWVWGSGILTGTNIFTNITSPIQITSPKIIDAGLSSESHTIAVDSSGSLYSWGSANTFGVLGNSFGSSSPVQVGSDTNWIDVEMGNGFSINRKTTNEIYAVGNNTYGQLGLNSISPALDFTKIGTDTNWSKIKRNIWSTSLPSVIGVKSNGTLWAWGYNGLGMLGDGTYTSRSSPVQIGLDTNWKDASIGESHTMAIKTDGTLWSWGTNGYGQIGNNTRYTSYASPIQIGSDTNWLSISAGRYHSMAVKTDGTLWSWGSNSSGQLGDGNFTDRSSPVQIGTDTDWILPYAGNIESYAIKSNGETYSWGADQSTGKLGLSRVYFSPLDGQWKSASGGNSHTIAVKNDGTLWAWGLNNLGQLGDGTTSNRSSPVQIGTTSDWAYVKAGNGSQFSFAIKTDGTLWSWGYNNAGQLGHGNITNRSSPTQVGTDTDWNFVDFFGSTTMATKTNGTLWGWGSNTDGRIGDGTTINRSSPVQIGLDTDWSNVSAGSIHTMAVKTDGTLWGWGANYYYNQGRGTGDTASRSSPTQVGSLTNWSKVFAGEFHTIAVASGGTIYGAGYNQAGTMGFPTPRFPVKIGISNNWRKMAAGTIHSAGIKTDGTLWGWGYNLLGALGDGTTINRSSPVQVGTDTDWYDISCGGYHTTAIRSNGTIWGWGFNNVGQVGDGTRDYRSSPVQIGADTNWSIVITGASHTMSIKTDGTLWAWGYNNIGELGDGTVISKSSPIQIGPDTNWSSIASNNNCSHTMAIKTNGTLWGWGYGADYGQIGDGVRVNRSSPVQIGSDTNWKMVSAGKNTTFAIKTDGTLWGWGSNNYGQIDTTYQNRSSPTQIGTEYNWDRVYTNGEAVHAVKSNGEWYSWGYGNNGQLANAILASIPLSDFRSRNIYLEDIVDVYGGEAHFLFLKNNSGSYASGNNSQGQLGLNHLIGGETDYIFTLTDYNFESNPNFISTANRTFLVDESGSLFFAGQNENGELGNYDKTNSGVIPLTKNNYLETTIVSASAGRNHSIILDISGSLYLAGRNNVGELGYGYTGGTPTITRPIRVDAGKYEMISNGFNYVVGIRTDGTLWGWGSNSFGQIGDTTISTRSWPVQISKLSGWSDISTGYQETNAIYESTGSA